CFYLIFPFTFLSYLYSKLLYQQLLHLENPFQTCYTLLFSDLFQSLFQSPYQSSSWVVRGLDLLLLLVILKLLLAFVFPPLRLVLGKNRKNHIALAFLLDLIPFG